jgi:DNA replicative helicase MCM subunit Mcm2 (Cdc46/Mcm family)
MFEIMCARRPFDLYREMPEFAEFFTEEPIEALKLLTRAIMIVSWKSVLAGLRCACGTNLRWHCVSKAQHNLATSATQQAVTESPMTIKSNVHARLGYMPHGVAEHNRQNVSSIRSSDVGMFLQVAGTVIRTGTVSMDKSKFGVAFIGRFMLLCCRLKCWNGKRRTSAPV